MHRFVLIQYMQALSFLSFLPGSDEEMDFVGDNGSASDSEPAKEHDSTGETGAEYSSTML